MVINAGLIRLVLFADPGRRRRDPAAQPRAGARPDRAELRALRRLALGGGAAAPARELARPAGEARRADPGDGGEPRRHPRGPRVRRAALRARQVRRGVRRDAGARRSPDRPPRPQHRRDDLRLLPRDGPPALGRRPEGAGGRDHRRHARRVPRLHGDPADAGAPARDDGQRLRPRLDVRRPAVRGARSRARDRRPAGRARPRGHRRGAALRERLVRLSSTAPGEGQRLADPARHQLRGARRPHARHRRPARQRQVDDRPSDPALLRRRRRADHDRRAGHAGRHARLAAPRGQPGPAGHLPVHRLDREQHRLRRSLGRARAHRQLQRGRAAARLRRGPAQGLRHPGRRARRVALGRPAPAPVDRAQHPAQPADPGVRRFDRGGRRRDRARASARRCGPRPRPARRSSSRTAWAR